MIVDIPAPEDYHAAGVNQLYLAWQITMGSLHEYDQVLEYGVDDIDEAHAEYWKRSQPALANAYSLIQQGMELALKGRIALVSPYLLIGDPGDWPGRAAIEDVSFGEFRTLDAADLVKVHNSVRSPGLSDQFRTFWDELRKERNKIMHSASIRSVDPGKLVRAILISSDGLFRERRWPLRLVEMEEDGRLAALGFNDDVQNNVMRQVDTALRYLAPAEAKSFLGFDKRRRAYVCPRCYWAANRDWQDEWPHLAQFKIRSRGTSDLYCIVCDEVTEVVRATCRAANCKGDAIADGICLTCTGSQDDR